LIAVLAVYLVVPPLLFVKKGRTTG
jgi:hypothetical protein